MKLNYTPKVQTNIPTGQLQTKQTTKPSPVMLITQEFINQIKSPLAYKTFYQLMLKVHLTIQLI